LVEPIPTAAPIRFGQFLSGWQQLPPPEFLVAKFSIAGADGASAQVNVSSLAGEGGGFLANVNRWRGQLVCRHLRKLICFRMKMELMSLVARMELLICRHGFQDRQTVASRRRNRPAKTAIHGFTSDGRRANRRAAERCFHKIHPVGKLRQCSQRSLSG